MTWLSWGEATCREISDVVVSLPCDLENEEISSSLLVSQ
jgi:hypothetical protein